MKYPYIILFNKKKEYCGILHSNDVNDKCEGLIPKDCTSVIKYSKIKFEEDKKTCKNNLDLVEKDLKLK